MKTLIALLLISNIVLSQNLHLEYKLYQESTKQAYIGMVLTTTMYFAKYLGKTRQQSNIILCAGITLNIANITYFGIKKRKIRNRIKLKK